MNALAPIDQRPLAARTVDEARQPLFILFSAYPEPWSDKNAERASEMQDAKVSAYMLGLQGIPGWAILDTVTAFIQGRVERPARRLGALPTVEEIASEARALVEKEHSKQRAAALVREAIAERKASEFPPDHRARMCFKYAVLSAGLERREVEKVREANDRGLEDMVALAQTWRVPVPEIIWKELARA